MSTKYTTVSIRVKENVKEALDKELAKLGCKSYKVLLEMIITGYANSKLAFFNSVSSTEEKRIDELTKSIAECQELIEAESDDRIKAILVSQKESLQTRKNIYIQGLSSAMANKDYYSHFLYVASPPTALM